MLRLIKKSSGNCADQSAFCHRVSGLRTRAIEPDGTAAIRQRRSSNASSLGCWEIAAVFGAAYAQHFEDSQKLLQCSREASASSHTDFRQSIIQGKTFL